ncbi:Transcription factor spt20 [Dimargaris verticillata]|uniref:Transcription factor spt20 n=1 Tax=Dimargaris verticillata TaxID=2761393 RepID=A0A9W8E7V6_9FUNG|nr:Transcription factor spt20 [Dimargaris verticillata]
MSVHVAPALSPAAATPQPQLPKRPASDMNGTGVLDAQSSFNHAPAHSCDPLALVRQYQGQPPSATLHIHSNHFRFDHQDGVFLLSSPMRFFLDFVRDGIIPVDLLDVFYEANAPFYQGGLIIEIHDHRLIDRRGRKPELPIDDPHATSALVLFEGGSPDLTGVKPLPSHGSVPKPLPTTQPRIVRKVLFPSQSTVWADFCLLNQTLPRTMTEEQVLELESKVLLATEEPLCLDPSFQVSRVSNAIEHASYQGLPPRKRRKFNSTELEAEEAARKENENLMLTMDDRHHRDFQPSFNRLLFIQEWRRLRLVDQAKPTAMENLFQKVPEQPASLPLVKKSKSKKARSATPDAVARPTPPLVATQNPVYQPIRTLRFECDTAGKKTYSGLYVYRNPTAQQFKCLLRWGSVPDTSINGDSLEFVLENQQVLDTYLANFKSFYGAQNRLVSDSKEAAEDSQQPSTTVSPAVSRPPSQPPVTPVAPKVEPIKTLPAKARSPSATPKTAPKALAATSPDAANKKASPRRSKKSKKATAAAAVRTQSTEPSPLLAAKPALPPLAQAPSQPSKSSLTQPAGGKPQPATGSSAKPSTKPKSKSKASKKGSKVQGADTKVAASDATTTKVPATPNPPVAAVPAPFTPQALGVLAGPTEAQVTGSASNTSALFALPTSVVSMPMGMPAMTRSSSVASNPISSPHLLSPRLPIQPSPMPSPSVANALARKLNPSLLGSPSPRLVTDQATFSGDAVVPPAAPTSGGGETAPAAALAPNPLAQPVGGGNMPNLAALSQVNPNQLQAFLLSHPLYNTLVAANRQLRSRPLLQQFMVLQAAQNQQQQMLLRQQQQQQAGQAMAARSMPTSVMPTQPIAAPDLKMSGAGSVYPKAPAALSPMTPQQPTGVAGPNANPATAAVSQAQIDQHIQSFINRGIKLDEVAAQVLRGQGKDPQAIPKAQLEEIGRFIIRQHFIMTVQNRAAAGSAGPMGGLGSPNMGSTSGLAAGIATAQSKMAASAAPMASAVGSGIASSSVPGGQAFSGVMSGAQAFAMSKGTTPSTPQLTTSRRNTPVPDDTGGKPGRSMANQPVQGMASPSLLMSPRAINRSATSTPVPNKPTPPMPNPSQGFAAGGSNSGGAPMMAATNQAAALNQILLSNPNVRHMLSQVPPQLHGALLEQLLSRNPGLANMYNIQQQQQQQQQHHQQQQRPPGTPMMNAHAPNANMMAAARNNALAQQLQNQAANQFRGMPVNAGGLSLNPSQLAALRASLNRGGPMMNPNASGVNMAGFNHQLAMAAAAAGLGGQGVGNVGIRPNLATPSGGHDPSGGVNASAAAMATAAGGLGGTGGGNMPFNLNPGAMNMRPTGNMQPQPSQQPGMMNMSMAGGIPPQFMVGPGNKIVPNTSNPGGGNQGRKG